MSKTKKIIYWIATVWLAFGMTVTAVFQLLKGKEQLDVMSNLGYPVYFLTIIGVWKILGSIAILAPKSPLIKEWAYAGFFFAMSGAIFSHVANGDAVTDLIGPTLLLVLTIVSWYLRPTDRKIVTVNA